MKYAELSDSAKETARDDWRDICGHDTWWDGIYEDAIACAAKLGIEIGTQTHRTASGKSVESPDIAFSGFWSQGDGCSFGGRLRLADMQHAGEQIRQHVGEDEELFRLAAQCEAIWQAAVAYRMMHRLDENERDDYPEYGPNTVVYINGDSHHGFSTRIDDNEVPAEAATNMNSLVGDFADWIYGRLRDEDEYRTLDETIETSILANDPEFDEDGNLL